MEISIEDRYITKPGELGSPFNHDDGIGITGNHITIENCIVDFSNVSLESQDEACAVTLGASAIFKRCIFRNTGKLFLIGSEKEENRNIESGKKVIIENCILENFGRRGPEIQNGMICEMDNCLVRYWANPNYFSVRSFGAWAHRYGGLFVKNSIFLPILEDNIPFKQRFWDRIHHIGQALNDEGLKGLFQMKTYIAGFRKALVSTDRGHVEAKNCWFSHSCYTDSNIDPMTIHEFELRMKDFYKMETELYIDLSVF